MKMTPCNSNYLQGFKSQGELQYSRNDSAATSQYNFYIHTSTTKENQVVCYKVLVETAGKWEVHSVHTPSESYFQKEMQLYIAVLLV